MRFSLRVAMAALVIAASFRVPGGAAPLAATPLHTYSGVAISSDGTLLADVETTETADPAKEPEPHLIVRAYGGGAPREIALPCAGSDGCSVSSPVWSPVANVLAYVVHAKGAKVRELYLARVAPGDAPIVSKRLLAFSGTLVAPRFARDGSAIDVLATPNARKEIGATQAGTANVGEIGTTIDEQRIAVVPLDGSALKYASPPDLFVYEYDSLPQGGFVGTAAHGDGDDNWWIARLYRFEADGAVATELYAPPSAQMQLAQPRVAPDGKSVAFIAGIMSDFGSTGGDLYTLALDGSRAAPLDLTPGLAASITSLRWFCRSDRILFTQLKGDRSEIGFVDPSTPQSAEIVGSDAVTYSAGDGGVAAACETPGPPVSAARGVARTFRLNLATAVQSFERPPELATARYAFAQTLQWQPITAANAGIPAEARAQSIAWTDDGFNVQGWLLVPPNAPPGKRPAITIVHGGPAAANVPRFVDRGALRDLLRHGYDIFLPNPRGSFGQGETFTLANVKDFGYGDLRDIMSGIDAAEKAAPVDEARLGIMGGSYGGFMTMWAVTQTHRFKAAVAGAGISDWVSYYGENGIDEWMIPYFGASVYDDPAVYRKSSPIDFIKNVTTPTFAYVGELDVECPAPQSLEFWHALHALGVPTSLVIYPGEGHRIRDAAHQADVAARSIAWFDSHLR